MHWYETIFKILFNKIGKMQDGKLGCHLDVHRVSSGRPKTLTVGAWKEN